MNETKKIEPAFPTTAQRLSQTTPLTVEPEPQKTKRGIGFYVRGSILFFKKMWPTLFELTSTETYVNASAIAFNVMLSFFSFVVLMGSFLINIVGSQRAYETLFRLMRSLMPLESGMLLNSLDQVTRGPSGKATLMSFGLLIFSASGVFQPLEAALNRAWKFKERNFVKQYLVYMLMVLICSAIILCPVALGSVYDFVLVSIFGESSVREWFFKIAGPVMSLPFLVLLFFVIYYFIPNGKVKLNQVVFTSVAIAVLWLLATFAFWLLLPVFDFAGSYKQLASLMALVTWVFISSFILIMGADLSARQIIPQSWTGWMPLKATKKLDETQVSQTPASQVR
ncbi:MAG: YihY/virulence factor BrkB family protein [Acidobacteria bacterium]|nr:YihY/virulence factor BrkB family protein [Acidobacteriota bacterium]